ncbi:hypothetical protein [Sideroxydans sp. CL21]|nr:hypothetical protein [Sideroxydans sp. CL21]
MIHDLDMRISQARAYSLLVRTTICKPRDAHIQLARTVRSLCLAKMNLAMLILKSLNNLPFIAEFLSTTNDLHGMSGYSCLGLLHQAFIYRKAAFISFFGSASV